MPTAVGIMTSLTLLAPAKINLFLRIVRRRPDGYHDLETVFQRLDWGDEVTLSFAEADGLTVAESPWEVGPKDSNLAWRALMALRERVPELPPVAIELRKRVPPGAGLGGGSSDAATVLRGVNKLCSLGLDEAKLMEIGRKLGADVPFLVGSAPCAIGRGIGDELEPVAHSLQAVVTLLYPGQPSSTADAYAGWSQSTNRVQSSSLDDVVSALKSGDAMDLARAVHNDFTEGLQTRHSFIARAMKEMENTGAFGAVWPTGSGSTVVGLGALNEPPSSLASMPGSLWATAPFLHP